MKQGCFQQDLADYILSGHAYLHCPTTEKTRFLSELKDVAASLPNDGRRIWARTQPPSNALHGIIPHEAS